MRTLSKLISTCISGIVKPYQQAYTGLPREAWILSMVEFINRSGSMVFFFMVLYLTQNFGVSAAKAGHAITIYGLGALLGAYLGGKLTDSMGAYRVQKFSLIFSGIIYIVMGQLNSYWWILLAMFILGVLGEALHPANATAMSQVCPAELRTKGFALNRLAVNLGIMIGPLVGGYLALINYKLLFWIDGITCLLAAIIFQILFKNATRPAVQENKETTTPPIALLHDIFFLKILVLVFFLGLVFVQLFSTFSLYCKTVYGLQENYIGLLLSINTIIIALFEMILMERLKNTYLHHIIAVGSFLLCLGFALMPLGRGLLYAAFTVVVWTHGEMLSLPPLTTLIANHSHDSVRGKYMGLYSFAFSLSLAIGPTIGTTIYSTFGPNMLWLGCGIMGVLLSLGFLSLHQNESSNE